MTSMQLRRDDVIVGVDTHKDQHVAVVLDGLGTTSSGLSSCGTTAAGSRLGCVALPGQPGHWSGA